MTSPRAAFSCSPWWLRPGLPLLGPRRAPQPAVKPPAPTSDCTVCAIFRLHSVPQCDCGPRGPGRGLYRRRASYRTRGATGARRATSSYAAWPRAPGESAAPPSHASESHCAEIRLRYVHDVDSLIVERHPSFPAAPARSSHALPTRSTSGGPPSGPALRAGAGPQCVVCDQPLARATTGGFFPPGPGRRFRQGPAREYAFRYSRPFRPIDPWS